MTVDELFETHRRFACALAARYQKRHPEISERLLPGQLQQEALIGLWSACQKYEESKGKFTTYAAWRIVGAIKDMVRNEAGFEQTIDVQEIAHLTGCDTNLEWEHHDRHRVELGREDRPIIQERAMKVLGIDNGLRGALVCLNTNNATFALQKTVMPIIESKGDKTEYDVGAITDFIVSCAPDHIYLEYAYCMPKMAVQSVFSTANGFGIMRGIIGALKIPHTLVRPQEWQKAMFCGCGKNDTKATSVKVCKRLFPQFDWRATERCKKAHDGLTDAALIAEYGRRLLAGNDTTF